MIDLLPHAEIVIGARVEVERDPVNVVEHDVRPEHVRDIGQGPGSLLRHTRKDIVEDFEGDNEHDVDGPGSCKAGFEVSGGSKSWGAIAWYDARSDRCSRIERSIGTHL